MYSLFLVCMPMCEQLCVHVRARVCGCVGGCTRVRAQEIVAASFDTRKRRRYFHENENEQLKINSGVHKRASAGCWFAVMSWST